MSGFLTDIKNFFTEGVLSSIRISDIIDIGIIAFAIYQVLKLFKNTRAIQVLKGIGFLLIALAVSSWLGLPATTWLLNSVFTSGIVVIVILFQPEIRRVFENLGRGHIGENEGNAVNVTDSVTEICKAVENLSRRHVGALMVFEKNSDLKDIIETGTILDAAISSGLIENVFEPNTPLHDGAMILKGSKIVAAGCFLPLSENNRIEKTLGTRHRAALGISEHSDAKIVIVSEENGIISIAQNGSLRRYLDLDSLKDELTELFGEYSEKHISPVSGLFSKLFGKENDNEQ